MSASSKRTVFSPRSATHVHNLHGTSNLYFSRSQYRVFLAGHLLLCEVLSLLVILTLLAACDMYYPGEFNLPNF